MSKTIATWQGEVIEVGMRGNKPCVELVGADGVRVRCQGSMALVRALSPHLYGGAVRVSFEVVETDACGAGGEG